MEKLLFIAYNFPPVGGPGVPRNVNFVRHLPSFGFAPYVIAPENPSYYYRDDSDLAEIEKNAKISRTKIFETLVFFKKLYFGLAGFLKKAGSEAAGGGAENLVKPGETGGAAGKEKKETDLYATVIEGGKFFTSLKRAFRDIAFFPDDKNGWIYYVVKEALRLIDGENIGLMHTTSFPYSAHLAGLIVKKLRPRVKWVADFRDPWSTVRREYEPLKAFRKMAWLCEDLVLKNADAVTIVSEPWKEDFVKDHPKISGLGEKIKVITNGFERVDLKDGEIDPAKFSQILASGKLTVNFTGYFYAGLSDVFHVFLNAVSALVKKGLVDPGRIQINLIGQKSDYSERSISDADAGGYCKTWNYVPRRELEYIQRNSTLLLLLTRHDVRGWHTSKLFEYLGAGRPIFAVCNSHDVAGELVRGLSAGSVIDAWDISRIEKEFLDIYRRFIKGEKIEVDSDKAGIEKFTRKNLTEQLAGVYRETLKR